ncbi:DUF4256 domain-containing protein [Formosa maritima]|uniref:DUF4256 domain-containing protein n=1 Tax=Formosa maritima TaxID=2592046 RepID=A0A5D0G2E9_9FLAO|nr:DUF4256 domain-containing protein [Formosa maritima]TYA52995.1 DUF4256 domain-containing protein [Formosa maritima]
MKKLVSTESEALIKVLKTRFENNTHRHQSLEWSKIKAKLDQNPKKLWSLNEMEKSGGEPDVVDYNKQTDEYIFYDCSKESPSGRRSACYDLEALESRKKFKPENNAIDMAKMMGIDILTVEEYQYLQKLETFDLKTSSWLKTPQNIRKLGGAIFGDNRFENVFIYHNGAESYYAGRGFRGSLRV